MRSEYFKNRTKIIYAADNNPSSEEYRREILYYDRIHIVKSDKVPIFRHKIILKHSHCPKIVSFTWKLELTKAECPNKM